jgi:proline iminopeptidase
MENYVFASGGRIWTDMNGHGQKYVLLCSGGPGLCDYMRPVSQMIEDGYAVIRFEQRGCGRSSKDGKYDLQTAVSDMEAIRASYGISSWTVGGHSWGANLSLAYAIAHPDRTDALLYLAGNGVQRDKDWLEQYHLSRDKFGEAMPPMPVEPNKDVNAQCNQSWYEYIHTPSLYKDISKLGMPALVMCASKDVRPNWPALQVHALLQNAELVMIDGAAHYIWLTHAAEMKEKLRAFLELPVA